MESTGHPLQALWIVCLVVTLIVFGTTSAFIIARRNVFPISGRSCTLVIAIDALMKLELVTNLIVAAFAYGEACWTTLVVAHAILGLSSTLTARVFRLWYQFFNAQERLQIFRTENTDIYHEKPEVQKTRAQAWFSKRPYLAKMSFIWKVILGVTIVDAIAVHSIWWQSTGLTCIEQSAQVAPYYYSRGVFTAVVVTILFWKIRHAHDAYGIRNEFLLFAAGAWLIMAVKLTELFMTVAPDLFGDGNLAHDATLIITWAWYTFYGPTAAFIIPILQSYGVRMRAPKWYRHLNRAKSSRMRRGSISATELYALELKDVLTQEIYKDFRQSFENQLAREFSTESIVFYEATRKFRENHSECSDAEVATRALQIYCEFLARDSPTEVNISDRNRTPIRDTLTSHIANFKRAVKNTKKVLYKQNQNDDAIDLDAFGRIPADVFEAAHNEIYNLMASDSFSRWVSKRANEMDRSKSGNGGTRKSSCTPSQMPASA